MKRVVVASLLLGLLACGPKPDASGPALGTLPDVPFEQYDHDQKILFMKQVVVPKMRPLFQAHDAAKYKEFGCKTCHGPAADNGEFHMPNDDLPKLNFADMSQHKPVDIEWMKRDIKPTMAKLLKEEEHSPANPQGFGCLHCHAQVGAAE